MIEAFINIKTRKEIKWDKYINIHLINHKYECI